MAVTHTGYSDGNDNEEVDIQELIVSIVSVAMQKLFDERTWKSPNDDAKEYKRVIVVN